MALRTATLPGLDDARGALAATGRRLTELIRDRIDARAPAVGHWSVGDVAAHLSHVYAFDAMSASGVSSPSAADLPDFVAGDGVIDAVREAGTVTDVGRINDAVLARDPERDLGRLADRIERSLGLIDEILAAGPETRTVTWLGGATLPLVAIAGHVLFEANGHGTDIARASGRRWPIDPGDVRIVFGGFLAPFIDAAPSMLASPGGPAPTGCIDLRLRGQTRAWFVFGPDGVRVARDAPKRVDLHVSADPATFFLVMAGRMGRASAALRGGMVAWGKRPLHGLKVMSTMRSP